MALAVCSRRVYWPAGAAVYLSPQGTAIEEQFGLYWLFHLRGERTAPADVVVIAVDQASATHLELPLKPSLWSRALHARLIDRLVEAGARVVVFDLVFDRPGSDARHDKQFAAALKHAGNVVLVERLDFEEPGSREWLRMGHTLIFCGNIPERFCRSLRMPHVPCAFSAAKILLGELLLDVQTRWQ